MTPMAMGAPSSTTETPSGLYKSDGHSHSKEMSNGYAKTPETLDSRSDSSQVGSADDPSTCQLLQNVVQVVESGVLQRLYSISVEAKIWGTASKGLNQANPPRFFPEYTRPGGSDYVYRDLSFWTSGFFPGNLYLLLERRKLYPNLTNIHETRPHTTQLENACKWWTESLHQNATLKGTHDLGFMVMPWASRAWKLNGDSRALETMKTTAQTLFDRIDPKIGCMRSWDTCTTKKYNFQDPSADYLVIIDNMMNLDLLFFVADHTNNQAMRDAAIQHARTSARSHIREDFSTTHVVNFNPSTGVIKEELTNQGFSHTSCWSRGQAWAIAGFAETYHWTRMNEFLDTSRTCADYFLERLPPSGVAPWDFDAYSQTPAAERASEPTDTSATMIAAYGMLLLHKAITQRGEQSPYLSAALTMANAVSSKHLNQPARYSTRHSEIETVEHGVIQVPEEVFAEAGRGDTIVNGATINNYEFAPRRWANHGLVYADYYYLLFGNELLKMDLGTFLGGSFKAQH